MSGLGVGVFVLLLLLLWGCGCGVVWWWRRCGVLVLLCCGFVFGGGLLVGVAPVSARVVHSFQGSFDGVEAPGGPLKDLWSVAADDSGDGSSGDVYVGQTVGSAGMVYRFAEGGGYGGLDFGGSGSLAGSFSLYSGVYVSGVAVDDSGGVNSGDVYVADLAHGVVDRFSAAGVFLCQISGTAPSGAAGQAAECNGAVGSATPNGGFEPAGVAVDPSNGEVYVSDVAHGVVDEFGVKGEYVGQITSSRLTSPGALAVSGAGDVFVVNTSVLGGGEDAVQFSATGGFVRVLDEHDPVGVAVDPSDEHVFLVDTTIPTQVSEYTPAGVLFARFGSEQDLNKAAAAVSVNGAGKVFVVSSAAGSGAAALDIWGPTTVEPEVSVKPATDLSTSEATLNGETEPDGTHESGPVSTCRFEYVPASGYAPGEPDPYGAGGSIACAQSTPYTTPTPVSATVSGLAEDTAYDYRLAAASANGAYDYTSNESFTTPGKPTVEGQKASGVTRRAATIEAKIDPHDADTTYQIEYGESEGYGRTIPVTPVDVGGGETAVAVSQSVTALKLGTTYYYRFTATNAHGTGEARGRFATLPVAGVEYETALGEPHAASVQVSIDPYGNIEPLGDETTCRMQYLSEAEYQSYGYAHATTVACSPASIPADSSGENVIVRLAGLTSDTVYRYRFLVGNETGEAAAAEATFTTFGVEAFTASLDDEAGEPYTRAGGRPYALTTSISLRFNREGGVDQYPTQDGALKDISVQLPPGLIGNPSNFPKCTEWDSEEDVCDPAAQVGTISITRAEEGHVGGMHTNTSPLFNAVPEHGVAAELVSQVAAIAQVKIDASVRTGSDYGITTASLGIGEVGKVLNIAVTIWGVPAEPSHDPQRACANTGPSDSYQLGCTANEPPRPFLSDPASCEGPLESSVETDSYQAPGAFVTEHTELSQGMSGCKTVPFTPTIQTHPTTSAGDTATGLNLDVHVPQHEEPNGLATSDLKNASVTLPPGLVVNPSSANELEACSEEQVGFTHQSTELDPASEPGMKTPQFTPGAAECPNGSKLGTVTIHTPLLEHPLKGAMYLATPHENPFGSLIALYLTVDDPTSGVIIKLPGKVEANPTTGQLTAIFDQDPQLPFEDLEVSLFNGSRASLTTPLACGAYSVSSTLEPWSHKGATGEEGTPDATPSSEPFQVSEDCAGQESEAPNKPSFEAGTASPIAGSYSPFVLKLSREDGSQRFGALNVTLPPGLLGKVAGVEQCPQADIDRAESRSHEGEGALEQSSPSCPSGSEVGVVHVGAGSGAPYYVTGKAYFAGPYEGAPFSLVIVTPALAGPFDLGTVVVRAGLYINPHTAQVTVRSDPFPTILDGIPLDIRSVGVEINRHEFTLNPTSCEAMSVAGEEQSTAGQTASLSSRFKAEGCTNLPFHPSFTASTQGSTSKANGASLTVKVNPLPGQANIAKVDLTLPKQLPARLTTLQKACTEAQFNANPAGCPEASDIGTAIAHTPILSSPLQGPAYLVSHGGAAFPDVEFVLQGENGVEIVLDGGTQIKDGITYSKFETVPDAPITSFETVLPEGPHSVLATDIPASAKYSLCGQSLQMPTTITGQNGVVVNQTTNIAVTGCKAVKTKPLTRAQKLAAALKKCRTKYKTRKRRSKRVACEKAARLRFGPKIKEKAGRRAKRKK